MEVFTTLYPIFKSRLRSAPCDRRFYPAQKLPVEVYFFYAFELGIYLHLSVYQFSDTKRSDFWEMFVHHLATTALIVLSWLSG